MSELQSSDGRYVCADQGDGNFVVYRRHDMQPVWDKWSYEHKHGIPPNPTETETETETEAETETETEEYRPDPSSAREPRRIATNVNPIGMSYWRNINYHAGSDELLVALSERDELLILTIDKRTLEVVNKRYLGIHHTGEGIFFSAAKSNILYVNMDGILIAVNLANGAREVIWMPTGRKLWQVHASHDEKVFSATLQDMSYNAIEWGILTRSGIRKEYPINNIPDECQIDKSGKYLIIKEKTTYDDGKANEYNRIIDIESGEEEIIDDRTGAVGHSDVGFGMMAGEDNYVGGLVKWDIDSLRKEILLGPNIWNMGYVSFQNNTYLVSLPNGDLILIRDGERGFLCSALTDNQEYENRVKANLCPLAEYVVWTARDGNLNAYIVRI